MATFAHNDAVTRLSLSSSTLLTSSTGSDESRTTLLPTKETLDTDLLSPRLPSMIPDHGRSRVGLLKKWLRLTPWFFVACVLFWMSSAWYSRTGEFRTDISYLRPQGDETEVVNDNTLPSGPMPVIVKDMNGETRWTISMPLSLTFPLTPSAYADLCSRVNAVQQHISPSKGGHNMLPYYHVDDEFMDVDEAESLGLLPNNLLTGSWAPLSKDPQSLADENGYCRKTLTFVMEATDAGMGNTLMQLWLSYGLAQKEGRAFFIDDRYW